MATAIVAKRSASSAAVVPVSFSSHGQTKAEPYVEWVSLSGPRRMSRAERDGFHFPPCLDHNRDDDSDHEDED